MQTTRAAEWQRCMASYESLRLNNLMTLNFYGLIPAAVRTFKRVLFLNDCEWKILSEFNSSANPNVAKLLWIFHFTGKRTRRMVIVNTLLNVKHLNSDLNHRKLRVLPSWYLHIVIMLLNLRFPHCFIPLEHFTFPFLRRFSGKYFDPVIKTNEEQICQILFKPLRAMLLCNYENRRQISVSKGWFRLRSWKNGRRALILLRTLQSF